MEQTIPVGENYPPSIKPKQISENNGQVDLAGLNVLTLYSFGADLAQAVADGNSDLFRQWADAIDQAKAFRPGHNRDRLRAELLLYCNPSRPSYSMRDIIAHLFSRGIITTKSHDDKRIIRRICAALNLPIKGVLGRPKKGTQNRKKSK